MKERENRENRWTDTERLEFVPMCIRMCTCQFYLTHRSTNTPKKLFHWYTKKHTVHQFLGTPHSYTHSTIGSGVFESSNISAGGILGFAKKFFFQISESRWISQIVAPPTSTFYTLIKHSFYWHCFIFISRCYLDTLTVFVYSYRFGKSTEPFKIEEHLIFHHWYLHENPRIVNL